jgi:hypothetical protein
MAAGKKTGGRVKGTPNALSGGVKSNIIGVFDKIGGRDQMARWAQENQTEFYKLYGRLLPTEVTGEGGGALLVTISAKDAEVL